jgi:undecaprenyl-diphosphatase
MPRSTSFPSGHSAAAFAFATGACDELPVLAPVLVPLAGAVAYSRVHIGVHYPSDVAAGAAIGIGSGVLATRLPRWAHQRRGVGCRDADVDP